MKSFWYHPIKSWTIKPGTEFKNGQEHKYENHITWGYPSWQCRDFFLEIERTILSVGENINFHPKFAGFFWKIFFYIRSSDLLWCVGSSGNFIEPWVHALVVLKILFEVGAQIWQKVRQKPRLNNPPFFGLSWYCFFPDNFSQFQWDFRRSFLPHNLVLPHKLE